MFGPSGIIGLEALEKENQIEAQRQRVRFGEEEQRHERTIILAKFGANDTKLAPTWFS